MNTAVSQTTPTDSNTLKPNAVEHCPLATDRDAQAVVGSSGEDMVFMGRMSFSAEAFLEQYGGGSSSFKAMAATTTGNSADTFMSSSKAKSFSDGSTDAGEIGGYVDDASNSVFSGGSQSVRRGREEGGRSTVASSSVGGGSSAFLRLGGGGMAPFSGTSSTPLTAEDHMLLRAELIKYFAEKESVLKSNQHRIVKVEDGGAGSKDVDGYEDVSSSDYYAELLKEIQDEADAEDQKEACRAAAEATPECTHKEDFNACGGAAEHTTTNCNADVPLPNHDQSDDRHGEADEGSLRNFTEIINILQSQEKSSERVGKAQKQTSVTNTTTLGANPTCSDVTSLYYPYLWNVIDDDDKALLKEKSRHFGRNDIRVTQQKEVGKYVTYCIALLKGIEAHATAASRRDKNVRSSEDVVEVRSPSDALFGGDPLPCSYPSIRVHAIGDGIPTAVRVVNIVKERLMKKKKTLNAQPSGREGVVVSSTSECGLDHATNAVASSSAHFALGQETSIDTVWCSTIYVLRPSHDRSTKDGHRDTLYSLLPERVVIRHKTPIITMTLKRLSPAEEEAQRLDEEKANSNPLQRTRAPPLPSSQVGRQECEAEESGNRLKTSEVSPQHPSRPHHSTHHLHLKKKRVVGGAVKAPPIGKGNSFFDRVAND